MPKRAAIYVRVSTDKQTVENQLRELRHRGGRTRTRTLTR
jgi:DNA invertase Pin-like site-specific DNA recombinase